VNSRYRAVGLYHMKTIFACIVRTYYNQVWLSDLGDFEEYGCVWLWRGMHFFVYWHIIVIRL